ncbi:hypothetical protein D3C81_1907180 [compost metagenome]
MQQLMLNFLIHGPWLVTQKGDRFYRQLADQHYSRQQHVGAPMFIRPGNNLVLSTAAGDAVWVTWPGFRDNGLQV